jgi:hypothetical protein
MNYFVIAVEIVSGAGVILGVVSAFLVWIKRLVEGQKCQLRSEMLNTYYKHKDSGKIRQYEFENFLLLYNAYKSLKGNSFIDKIHDEVIEWEVES